MEFVLFIIVIGWILYSLIRNQDISVTIERLRTRVEARESGKENRESTARLEQLENLTRFLQLRLNRLEGSTSEALPPFSIQEKPSIPESIPTPPPTPVIPATAWTPQPPRASEPISKPIPSPVPLRTNPVAAAWKSAPTPPIDWEKFMGVKLFAWLGGFALFLGMAFFVKYSIDHNLISPMARVIVGALTGIGVIIGGLALQKKNLDVTVQTLCAAGVSILYADIFACRSLYNFLTPEMAFPLMILVTITSFLLAVRLNSRYVAILGLIGGSLTPVLLSTGEDHAIALFSYITLLDVGVAAVAYKKRWGFLMSLSALATFFMEVGWASKFFAVQNAELGACIFFFFSLFYVIVSEVGRTPVDDDILFHGPGNMMPLAAMGFVAYMMSFQALAIRPGLVLTLLLALSALMGYTAVRREDSRSCYMLGGLVTFLLLGWWTASYLKSDLLLWGLGYYMAFGVLHAVLPILLQHKKTTQEAFAWGYAAPLLMLVMILLAMVFCNILSFLLWPFVFVLGIIAVTMAWLAGSVLAVAGTLILMMGSFGIWLFRLPDVGGLPGILTLLGFFSCAFFAWALNISRRQSIFNKWIPGSLASRIAPEDAASLPAMAAFMPFMLLAMVCLRLPLPDPSDVFGLMMLMVILFLGLVRYRGLDSVALIALGSTLMVEWIWHWHNFNPAHVTLAPLWYLAFYGIFTLFPFVASKHIKGIAPWIAAALAGPLHFYLFYQTVTHVAGTSMIGLLPAVFAMPALFGLYQVADTIPLQDERRPTLLALWGGVALFFITLIIPLQFDKEWITLGWTLEGAALLWLYRRISHEGLKAWGTLLLGVSFTRLALNPAVLSYHPRTAMPILNWYLFVYGVAALSFYAAARFLAAPRNKLEDLDLPPLFAGGGTVLLFLLLNIEIADFFSTGNTITFQFSGNLAQDMTYSLAWAIFAIVLLCVGIEKKSQGGRYASIGLLTLTLCKLFMHDLWRLGGLYRVASFVGLAVVLISVSFLYQKFLGKDKSTEAPHV